MLIFQSCTSVPHPSWKTGAHKADAGRQSGRAPRAPLPQAKQRLCPQPLLCLHHSSSSTGIAPQCPYPPGPGGPSLHTMPKHSLPFPTMPPAPLLAQPSCGTALADRAHCPHLPTSPSRATPTATTGPQLPGSCRASAHHQAGAQYPQ